MQKERWLEKNVDLALLNKGIEDFFVKRGFQTRIDTMTLGNSIVAMNSDTIYGLKEIIVKITGTPNDFIVEFAPDEHTRSSLKLGLITAFLGGGIIVQKSLKSQETLEKLEREFWVNLEENIGNLANSAKTFK